MSSELDELRKMVDQQLAGPTSIDEVPLHGEGVVPTLGEPGDPNAVRITVSGEAMNTAAGAVVTDAAGTQVATDLAPWPDTVMGKQVCVSGTVSSSTQGQGLQQATYSEIGGASRSGESPE